MYTSVHISTEQSAMSLRFKTKNTSRAVVRMVNHPQVCILQVNIELFPQSV